MVRVVGRQKLKRAAGILRGDDRCLAQHSGRARAKVGKVTDRRRNNVESAVGSGVGAGLSRGPRAATGAI